MSLIEPIALFNEFILKHIIKDGQEEDRENRKDREPEPAQGKSSSSNLPS